MVTICQVFSKVITYNYFETKSILVTKIMIFGWKSHQRKEKEYKSDKEKAYLIIHQVN